ncbi:hypothetical protein ACVCAH_28510 [Micromonospora sp. LZ34]
MQAAAMSLAAVIAAVAVVRAGRRRAAGGAMASDLPTRPDDAFAEAGIGASPIAGGPAGRETTSSAAAAR